jgi:hypothetical protein
MKYKTYHIEKRPMPGATFTYNKQDQEVPRKPKKDECEYHVHDTKDPSFRWMALTLQEAKADIDTYRAIELRTNP